MKFNWEKAGRKEGELQLGDTLWDLEGKVYLVARNEKPEFRILSIETAKSWLEKEKFQKISTDERVFNL